jgi:hypothetical protein
MATCHIWSCFLWQLVHCDESLKVMPHGVIPLYAFGLDDDVCFECLRQWSCTMFSLPGQWAFCPWLPTVSGKHSFLTDVIWGWVLCLWHLSQSFGFLESVLLIPMLHWYVLMIAVGMRLCTNVKVCFRKELGDVTLGTICRNQKSSAATYHEDVALSRNMPTYMVFPWPCEFSFSGHQDPVFLAFLLCLEMQQNLSGCRYCFNVLCLKFWADHYATIYTNWGIRNLCQSHSIHDKLDSLTLWMSKLWPHSHLFWCSMNWHNSHLQRVFLEFSLQP